MFDTMRKIIGGKKSKSKPDDIKASLNFYRTEYGQQNITYKLLTF